ncbi:hypothetical protein [Curtobacterium phage Penoan]|nr:hypothetical protein [Curtobacterium phage Penoan]
MPNVTHEAVQVDGLRRLRAALKRAGVSLDDLKQAHRDAGAIVKREAVVESPISARDTRHIRDTIRVGATKTAAVIRAGNARLPYGNPIHWGWYARHIKPQPWISTSAQVTEPTWTEVYWSQVEGLLDTLEGN